MPSLPASLEASTLWLPWTSTKACDRGERSLLSKTWTLTWTSAETQHEWQTRWDKKRKEKMSETTKSLCIVSLWLGVFSELTSHECTVLRCAACALEGPMRIWGHVPRVVLCAEQTNTQSYHPNTVYGDHWLGGVGIIYGNPSLGDLQFDICVKCLDHFIRMSFFVYLFDAEKLQHAIYTCQYWRAAKDIWWISAFALKNEINKQCISYRPHNVTHLHSLHALLWWKF